MQKIGRVDTGRCVRVRQDGRRVGGFGVGGACVLLCMGTKTKLINKVPAHEWQEG